MILWGLKKKITENLFNTESQQQLFSQIRNYYAHIHWDYDKYLVPSGFLNVDVKKSQHRLFNPTFKNVLTGFIMYDVMGEGANKNLARYQLDVIEGIIYIYSRCLNIYKSMEAMKYHHELDAAVAVISAEQAQYKENCRKEEANKVKEK